MRFFLANTANKQKYRGRSDIARQAGQTEDKQAHRPNQTFAWAPEAASTHRQASNAGEPSKRAKASKASEHRRAKHGKHSKQSKQRHATSGS